jgi:hypothetical protein
MAEPLLAVRRTIGLRKAPGLGFNANIQISNKGGWIYQGC